MENKKEFYDKVSEILGIAHEYVAPICKRTRWTNRNLGNGRYPGFGLVRCHGSCVTILSRKEGTKYFTSHEKAFEYLREYNNAA